MIIVNKHNLTSYAQLGMVLQPFAISNSAFPRKKNALGEWSLWLLALCLIARLTVLIRRRAFDDYQVLDDMAMLQVVIVGISLLLVFFSGRLKQVWAKISKTPMGVVLIFYLFCVLSAFWSPSILYSFYRAIEVISQILVILVALSYSGNFYAAERRIAIVITLSMILGMLTVIRHGGITLNLESWHTNQTTIPAMMLFTYAFGEILSGLRKERRFLSVVTVIGIFGVALGTSSASSISALIGVMIAMLLTRKRSKSIVLFIIILLFLSVVGVAVVKKYAFYGKTEENVTSLHGRMFIWKGYLQDFIDHPFVGRGFAISARVAKHYRTTNTHNSAISVILGTGLVGMGIVCVAFSIFLKKALSTIRQGIPGALGCVAAILAGLTNGMAVAFLGETYMMSSFSFFCMLCLFSMFVITGGGSRSFGQRLFLKAKSVSISPRDNKYSRPSAGL